MMSRCRQPVFCVPASLIIAGFLTISLPAHAQAERACAVTTKEEIAALAEHWNSALATGNPDKVTDLYAGDAVLLPMLSGEPRMGRQEIKAYFDEYLRRHPQGLINMRSIMVGCNVASDIGMYTYRLTGRRKGTRETVVGQYSTLYEFRGGKWLIVQQRASAINGAQKPGRFAAE